MTSAIRYADAILGIAMVTAFLHLVLVNARWKFAAENIILGPSEC